MADFGTKRQKENEQSSNLTASERTEGRGRQQGMERYQQGRQLPSFFSVSPGEFFTMSPITLMRRFTEDIDRAFGFSGRTRGGEYQEQEISWIPAVEIQQQGNNLLVRAELPGISENDVKVEATEEGLAIYGEKRQEHASEQGGWHHSERSYGRFYRLIPLPESAKVEEANAHFNNGVLEITVPVPELEKKRRQIPVGTSGQSRTQSGQSVFEQGTTEGRSRTAGSGR